MGGLTEDSVRLAILVLTVHPDERAKVVVLHFLLVPDYRTEIQVHRE